MLQSPMWLQLARIKFCFSLGGKRTLITREHLGPMCNFLDGSLEEIQQLKAYSNHWICKGRRSVAVAINLLHQNEIIAVPTDTIYGLVGVVSSNASIAKLYEIKKRDENKPLSICVSNVENVKKWGVVDHLPSDILNMILPGPYTVILNRTPALNPAFNPNHETVGIRVPNFKFITSVSEIVGPLALTSANVSNERSCLYASEFKDLWPKIGGIFHDCYKFGRSKNSWRVGSTIVDLSVPKYYRIVRYGINAKYLILMLNRYQLKCSN